MPDAATLSAEEIAKRDEEIAKLRADIEKMRAEGEIAKIADHCKAIGLNPDLAADIYAIRKASPDAAKKIEAELAHLSISAKAAEALTKRQGDAGKVASATDAEQEIEKKARALMDADKIPYHAAYEKVLRANPDLYAKTRGN